MRPVLMIILASAVANNAVIVRSEGLYQCFGMSAERKGARWMACLVACITLCSTAVCWPVYEFVIAPRDLDYLNILVFGFVMAVFTQLTEHIVHITSPAASDVLGSFLPLTMADCAILSVVTGAATGSYGYGRVEGHSFGHAMIFALGASLGFALAIFLLTGVREKLEFSDVPESFRGIPSTLIAAAIIGLAFIGFTGILEGLFMF